MEKLPSVEGSNLTVSDADGGIAHHPIGVDDIRLPHRGVIELIDFMWTTFDYGVHRYPSNADDDNSLMSHHELDSMGFNYSHPSDGASHRIQVRYYLNQFVFPIVFGVGIIGNVANLFLLSSRRLYPHRRQTTPMERSAVTGLKTLAASDLMFCIVGFVAAFVKRSTVPVGPLALIGVYYVAHQGAFVNVFLFTSTLLIMLISVERYIAVCHPFRAAALIRVRRTVCAHLIVFVVSALLNVPLFLRYSITCSPCGNESVCYYAQLSGYFTPGFMNVHDVVWFTVGTFIPLALILTSNALLVRELYRKSSSAIVRRGGSGMGASVSSGSSSRSRSINVNESEKTSTTRLTLTLLAVVVFFLFFVCPSMFLQFFKFVVGPRPRGLPESLVWPSGTEAFLWAVNITNLTQAIKFSSNFLLYCAINRTFRQMFARLVRGDSCRTQNEQPLQLQMQQQQLQHQLQQQQLQQQQLQQQQLQQQQQQQLQQQPQQQMQENGSGDVTSPCEADEMIEK